MTEWVGKIPTEEDFKERTDAYKDKGGSIVVLDDFGQQIGTFYFFLAIRVVMRAFSLQVQ